MRCLRMPFLFPVMPGPRLKMSRTSPDRASSLLSSPTPIGDPGLGGRCLERRGTTRRSSPTGSWCLCVGAGLGARPSFLFSCGVSAPHDEGRGLRGFAPARRGPFVSAKGPKTIGARAGPPRGGPCAPVPVVWAAELASLRQSSPPNGRDGTGAQPRPEAPGGGICLFCHARLDRASSLLSSPTSPAVIPDPDRGSRVLGVGLRGFGPARRGPFVSAKGPKTSGARAGPPRGGPCAPVSVVWAAELASLRQSSPPYGRDGTGAQPRPEAPGGGLFFCHPRPRSGIQGLGGGSLFGKTRDDTSPTGSWCLCVGAGLGARPSFLPFFLSFFLFSCGVSPPHDEVLLFRQKDPKPVAPGRGPPEGVPVPRSLVCGLRNSLRSDSPRPHMEGTGPGHSPARRRQDNGKE